MQTNSQPPVMPAEANDSRTACDKAVVCKELLAAVERCRDKWSERTSYLEDLAGYDKDVISMRHREHAKIIRQCISELYREVEAANSD